MRILIIAMVLLLSGCKLLMSPQQYAEYKAQQLQKQYLSEQEKAHSMSPVALCHKALFSEYISSAFSEEIANRGIDCTSPAMQGMINSLIQQKTAEKAAQQRASEETYRILREYNADMQRRSEARERAYRDPITCQTFGTMMTCR